MTDVEEILKNCSEIARDQSKCAKSRKIARAFIEVSHGVIDLKEENARLIRQIDELRIKVAALSKPPEAA